MERAVCSVDIRGRIRDGSAMGGHGRAAPPGPSRGRPTILGPFSVVLPGALWCSLSSRERNYPFFLRFKCMIGDLGVTAISMSP
jgi:hypothetical protein